MNTTLLSGFVRLT